MDSLDTTSDAAVLDALRKASRNRWWLTGTALVALAALVNSIRFAGLLVGGVCTVVVGLGLVWSFLLVVAQLRWRSIKREASSGSFSIVGNAIQVGETAVHPGSRFSVDEHQISVFVNDACVITVDDTSPYRILVARGKPLGCWVLLTDADNTHVGLYLLPFAGQLIKQLTHFGWSCTKS